MGKKHKIKCRTIRVILKNKQTKNPVFFIWLRFLLFFCGVGCAFSLFPMSCLCPLASTVIACTAGLVSPVFVNLPFLVLKNLCALYLIISIMKQTPFPAVLGPDLLLTSVPGTCRLLGNILSKVQGFVGQSIYQTFPLCFIPSVLLSQLHLLKHSSVQPQ